MIIYEALKSSALMRDLWFGTEQAEVHSKSSLPFRTVYRDLATLPAIFRVPMTCPPCDRKGNRPDETQPASRGWI